jgi:hypothetical protein
MSVGGQGRKNERRNKTKFHPTNEMSYMEEKYKGCAIGSVIFHALKSPYKILESPLKPLYTLK